VDQTWWGPLTPFQWACATAVGICGIALALYAHRTRARFRLEQRRV
jgi:hypothetical protein